MKHTDYQEVCDAISEKFKYTAPSANECRSHLKSSLSWAELLRGDDKSDCELLLNGGYGAAVESVTLISFGFVRPAILSLRAYYELSLMYLYYKDHPVEWRNTTDFRARPKLPGEVKK